MTEFTRWLIRERFTILIFIFSVGLIILSVTVKGFGIIILGIAIIGMLAYLIWLLSKGFGDYIKDKLD